MSHGITGRKFYCQNHKKNPEAPEKIFRCSSKNFSVFHEKFWPVSRDHFACHFKVIWPVPRSAFVPKWTKLQAEKKRDGANGATKPTGPNGKYAHSAHWALSEHLCRVAMRYRQKLLLNHNFSVVNDVNVTEVCVKTNRDFYFMGFREDGKMIMHFFEKIFI